MKLSPGDMQLLAAADHRNAPGADAEFSMISLGGRRLRCGLWHGGQRGAAPPLLLFNGIGMNMETLAPLVAALADRPVLMFDAPGIGGSPAPLVPYTPGMVAGWAAELLEKHGFDRVDVVGFSWGGAMAQHFAIRHGKRVRQLVLAAIGPGWPVVPGHPAALAGLLDPRWLAELAGKPRQAARRAAFAALHRTDRAALSPAFLERLRLPHPRGYMYQLMALAGWSGTLALPFLKVPTMVVMGEEDPIVPLANGRMLAALIPQARLELIAGAGHLFMLSHEPAFVRLLRGFLASDKQDSKRAA